MKWIKWILDSKIRLFMFFWLLLFVVYLPAWQAGFVSDFTGWLYDLRQSTFIEHINRSHFKVKSLYQFTQLVTWFFYQLFACNHFLWHCLHVTLHAVNVFLLFTISSTLFQQDNQSTFRLPLFAASILYCISPSLSEVIVWEASFHYLLGFFMLLAILRMLQLYLLTQRKLWLWLIFITYLLSTFSIELFYVTPFCVLGLILLQKSKAIIDPRKCKQTIRLIFLPQVALLFFHFVLVKINYGFWLPHIGAETVTDTDINILLSKPLKLIFHLLFLGRFFAQNFRDMVYLKCESYLFVLLFYTIILSIVLLGFKRLKSEGSNLLFLTFWSVLCVGLIIPLWFPQSYWVVYDRYAYFSMGLIFIVVSILLNSLLPRYVTPFLFVVFAMVNLLATYKVNKKWADTAKLTHQLMNSLPEQSSQKVLLLNMPHFMNGIYMIQANQHNEAQLIRNLLYQPQINYELIDVCANNIVSVNDGVHVKVLNDTMVQVILNQWGTWYWFEDRGATDYEHLYFSRKMHDNTYILTLKGNPKDYKLLYQVGNKWKEVQMSNKENEQY